LQAQLGENTPTNRQGNHSIANRCAILSLGIVL
jgi:hypothetical protein